MMTFAQLIAVPDGGQAFDPAHFAGVQVATSVPDRPVEADQARDSFQRHGLDLALLPTKRRPEDDFANACASIGTKRGKTANGTRERIDVGFVTENPAEVVYQIDREVIDKANRVIEHKKSMRVVFDKSTANGGDPIRVETPGTLEDYQALAHLEQAIRDHFDTHRGKIPGAKIRAAIRFYFLDRMGATRWADKQSVYFVPIEHYETVEKLGHMVGDLYPDDGDFTVLPLANTKGVLEIIADKHAAHVKQDAQQLLSEIADLRKSGRKIQSSTVARLVQTRRTLGQRRKRMTEIIGQETQTASAALDMLDEQLLVLMGEAS